MHLILHGYKYLSKQNANKVSVPGLPGGREGMLSCIFLVSEWPLSPSGSSLFSGKNECEKLEMRIKIV